MPPKVQNWKDVRAAVDLNPTKLEQARQREGDAQHAYRPAQVCKMQARM